MREHQNRYRSSSAPSPSLMIMDKDAKSALQAIFQQKTDDELLALSKEPVFTAEEQSFIKEALRARGLTTSSGLGRTEEQVSFKAPEDEQAEWLLRWREEYHAVPFPWAELLRSVCKFVFSLIVIGGIIYGCDVAFNAYLESTGSASHQLETDVWIRHEWLPGEVRECRGDPKVDILCSNSQIENDSASPVWSDGDLHTFIVTFTGRVDRGIRTDWSCTRGETDVVCKATD